MSLLAIALVVFAFAFAWSMGAHYTGACMGMPYASGSIRLRPALLLMALLSFLGAAFLSHAVLRTVGHHIIAEQQIGYGVALALTVSAFALTTLYTYLKIPTSTIQILVFCVVGAGLALGLPIHWPTIWHLAILWVLAPPVAAMLGYLATHVLDHILSSRQGTVSLVSRLLVLVGAIASVAMGANDVSNASGVFLMTGLFGVLLAGLIGGLGLAAGALTWGRPLLETVAFDIVKVDLNMASAAQFVQALVVLVAVAFGFFTSMNQALVGAMAGTGLARGRQTVQWPTVYGILRGWLIGPLSGLVLSYLLTVLLHAVALA